MKLLLAFIISLGFTGNCFANDSLKVKPRKYFLDVTLSYGVNIPLDNSQAEMNKTTGVVGPNYECSITNWESLSLCLLRNLKNYKSKLNNAPCLLFIGIGVGLNTFTFNEQNVLQ